MLSAIGHQDERRPLPCGGRGGVCVARRCSTPSNGAAVHMIVEPLHKSTACVRQARGLLAAMRVARHPRSAVFPDGMSCAKPPNPIRRRHNLVSAEQQGVHRQAQHFFVLRLLLVVSLPSVCSLSPPRSPCGPPFCSPSSFRPIPLRLAITSIRRFVTECRLLRDCRRSAITTRTERLGV